MHGARGVATDRRHRAHGCTGALAGRLALACLVAGCAQPAVLPPGPVAAPAPASPGPARPDARDRAQLGRIADEARGREARAVAVAHVEGVLPTTEAYRAAQAARRDWDAIAAAASLHALAEDPRDLALVTRLLAAWLDVYRISGNPIDETALGTWLHAERLVGEALPAPLRARLQAFACDLAARHLVPPPQQRRTSTNNWQSHRVKLAVMGAAACGDPALASRAARAFARQVDANLLPQGPSVDFVERDAVRYVVYSVEPLLEAALYAGPQGTALYAHAGPAGQSLAVTLAWLAPYARGERTHDEFARSGVRFDAERAAAGVPGYRGPYDPRQARYAFWLAAQLDARWAPVAEALGPPSAVQRAPWRLPR